MHRFGEPKPTLVSADVLNYGVAEDQVIAALGNVWGKGTGVPVFHLYPVWQIGGGWL
jgi:hypothetical protein